MNDDNPTRPFESVSADFFVVAGKSFLVVVDRLSGWPVVAPCQGDTTASNTIRIFCRYFREVGVPLRLRNRWRPPNHQRRVQGFMKRWGVRHMVTSPHYPQSNGHAEAAVKSIKHLILKTAPSGNIDCHVSLPTLKHSPKEWQSRPKDCDRRAAARYKQVKTKYDKHAHPLPPLSVGQQVRIQDPTSHRWDKVGTVMGHGRSRDYQIRLPSGRVWWRNRRFLRLVPPTNSDPFLPVPVAPSQDLERESLVSIPPVNPRRSQRLMEKESARECTTSVRGREV
ncbi:uncharacterized protein LOC135211285 [Macrobrachium nipponense]|uniref:uncharacterized protein LOC135211285 n=1 Tax=Macrobrachium nipponense TaxID=159736 RepID=UPI0030C847D1